LYDAAAEAPALGSIPFYQSCAQLLNDQGMLVVNIFGTPASFRRNCDQHIAMLSECFDAVCWLPLVHDANTVVLAFRSAPVIDFEALYERAAEIRALQITRCKMGQRLTALDAGNRLNSSSGAAWQDSALPLHRKNAAQCIAQTNSFGSFQIMQRQAALLRLPRRIFDCITTHSTG
jgi:hypothetical protein